MKILLAVDGSPAALAAVQHALALVSGGMAADFVLANVQEPPSLYEVVVAHDPEVLDAVRAAAGADLLEAATALLEAADASYETEVAGGEPGHVLVDLIENYGCDAVFAGASGAGGGDPGTGATLQALLRHSPVPVTVVGAPDPAA
ncbi:Universal stress protein UspA [Rubrivivax sp. A210]|uniref:universal stress protein n=1 Tax=Rubrivivax sp. A210 TaxID=2772301 RepID=UPI00191A6969|nr:universal stress protein [Rubrivivax sp. A210]CAD5369112.1 Universal stress protein UspA [Rubrivivax sp. A210]